MNRSGGNFIILNSNQLYDVLNLINGTYAPVSGFMMEKEFHHVLDHMRLLNGRIWTIPVILDITKPVFEKLKRIRSLKLMDNQSCHVATLRDIQIYKFNKNKYILSVFGTDDHNHPGVADALSLGDYLVGGKVIVSGNYPSRLNKYHLLPRDVRNLKRKYGISNLVAFQTRNIPHRSHEFLQTDALNKFGGLFINPVYGSKKADDFSDDAIIGSYEILIKKIYPKRKTVFSILPLRMRYAGPREALLHVVIRRNYGCTHFIVGRDHAGVKGYYRPYQAQEFLDTFSEKELGIKILKYPEVIACKSCRSLQFKGKCGHPEKDQISVSGTGLREMIKNRVKPPPCLIRPMIYNYLINHPSPFRK